MITGKEIQFDLDFQLKQIEEMLEDIKHFWMLEVLTRGNSFNYDSQDIYRQFVQLIYSIDLKNYYPTELKNTERIPVLNRIKKILEFIFCQYEVNYKFFKELDRSYLQLKKFREVTNSTLSDDDLRIRIYKLIEKQDRKVYFESAYFDQIGFLERNYHDNIFLFLKLFYNDTLSNLQTHTKYDDNVHFINDKPLFTLTIIGGIYNISNNVIFDNICQHQFYKEINFLHSISQLKICKDQNNCFYYMIHKLYDILSKEIKDKWLHFILKELGIKESTYKSKYRQVASKDASEISKNYRTALDTVFAQELVL